MASFRTTIKPVKQTPAIDYNSKIVLLGSCFTEHISQKLNYFKFKTLTNPFGIIFNTTALKESVLDCVKNKTYSKADLIEHDGLWHSFKHHSQFSSSNLDKTLGAINTSVKQGHDFFKTASHIVITLGTAWVYTYNDTQNIVANCHKIPQKRFTKSLQSIVQIKADLDAIYTLIKKVNPKVQFLFTVSPVRHLRNGFTENMLSKAHLIAAVQKHVEENKDSFYIPAYEIMMDDLRDYRFYDADMIHPNSTAINYIWDFFKNSWLSDKVFTTMKTIDGIQKDLQHRPFNTNTEGYKKFKKALDREITAFSKQHPNIKF